MRVGEKTFKNAKKSAVWDRRKQQNVRAITPRGKELHKLHKSPRGNIVYPILQFFIEVTRFSGFRQVKITGISELEQNEMRGRKDKSFCVRTTPAAPKGSA